MCLMSESDQKGQPKMNKSDKQNITEFDLCFLRLN